MAVIEQTGQVRHHRQRAAAAARPVPQYRAEDRQLHHFFDERGLLGIAFHPNYRENGKFYLAYSAPLRGDAELDQQPVVVAHQRRLRDSRCRRTIRTRPNATSERVVSQIDWPQFNHNGHWIGFGPDGMLYVSTGDGGYANDWGIGHNVATGNGQD